MEWYEDQYRIYKAIYIQLAIRLFYSQDNSVRHFHLRVNYQLQYTKLLHFINKAYVCVIGERGEPTQTQGEHANSTQRGPGRDQTQDLLVMR